MRINTYYRIHTKGLARLAAAAILAILAGIEGGGATTAAAQDTGAEATTLDRDDFTLKYPSTWKEDEHARDYKPDSNFTLNSPKNSYVQFRILDKTESPDKLLSMAVNSLDGPAINSLSKTRLTEWGNYKGEGMDMKGNILDSFPGGIIVFVFATKNHNVLIEEYYFSDELRDILGDIRIISNSFQVKD
jgi:hypothetical protein